MILSVQKAMNILSVISNEKNHPVSLGEIAKKTDYPKPTCSHILETLCQEGYTERVSHTEGYILGPAVYHLTRYGRYGQELISLCRPVMRWMERKSGATVVLSIIHNRKKFIIDYADREQNYFLEHPTIRTDDIYRTATGRAILAHLDGEEVRAIWEQYGVPQPGQWDEVTSLESLREELKKISRREIVVTAAPQKSGRRAAGYACPLFRCSTCIGAIGLAYQPIDDGNSIDPKTEETLKSVLKKGVREIERRLSYEF